ncbi:MAG: hypothetical protein SPI77_01100 [Corynebacterium sp.]|nr:hypothetical protein [Corynebacterium sp.]
MDMVGTQQWLTSLFSGAGELLEWVEPVDDSGARLPEGEPLGMSENIVSTCTFAQRDLGLVHGAQVWGMPSQQVRVELFGLRSEGVTPEIVQALFRADVTGVQPGATVETALGPVRVVAPTRWAQGLPQLSEPDRLTVLLEVQV